MTKRNTQRDLVLTFNETKWELKFAGIEEVVIEQPYPFKPEDRRYEVYDVILNGKPYKKIKVKLFNFPIDDYNVMTNVGIYKNNEYEGNTDFKNNDINLDVMVDIIKWVKIYGENKF